MNRPFLGALAAASALVLAGCATTASGESDDGGDGIRVVASTNVYGSLAEQVGGDRVEVTSIITSVSQDPHSYEATARDRLAVQNADLVIENGGGYDHFMVQLREDTAAPVVTAVEFVRGASGGSDDHGQVDDEHAGDADVGHSGHADDEHAGHDHVAGFNEHVWFDAGTMIHVVEAIADELGEVDPEGAAEYDAAAGKLIDELGAIQQEIDELAEAVRGTGVFLTEPLAGYLATQLELVDRAPEGFAAAVEEGGDVAPATLLLAVGAIEGGEVSAVLSNAQTGGAETERIEAAAVASGVPVVAFTELLTDGSSYAAWMREAISDLAAVLAP